MIKQKGANVSKLDSEGGSLEVELTSNQLTNLGVNAIPDCKLRLAISGGRCERVSQS